MAAYCAAVSLALFQSSATSEVVKHLLVASQIPKPLLCVSCHLIDDDHLLVDKPSWYLPRSTQPGHPSMHRHNKYTVSQKTRKY